MPGVIKKSLCLPWWFKDAAVIACLILAAACLQLAVIKPPELSDQLEYFWLAASFPHLPPEPTHWSMRIGLILPAAVTYRLFGYCELAYYLVPIISGCLLAVSVYVLGALLFNRRVGAAASVWTIFIPGLWLEYTHLLPDLPATACVTVSMAILFLALRLKGKYASWCFFLSGYLLGYAYLIKEYFMAMLLLVPAAMLAERVPMKLIWRVLAGAAVVITLEGWVNLAVYGNFFTRLAAAQPRETWGFIEKNAATVAGYLFRLLIKNGSPGSLAFLAAGLAGVFQKNRRMTFCGVWIVLVYALFTAVGLMPLLFNWQGRVLLRLHLFRYWILILPPGALGGVALLDRLAVTLLAGMHSRRKMNEMLVLTAMMAALYLPGLPRAAAIAHNPEFVANGATHYLELRQYLKTSGGAVDAIWVNRDSHIGYNRLLPLYVCTSCGKLLWHGHIKYLNTAGEYMLPQDIREGYVLLDRLLFNTRFQRIPTYMENPPANWRAVFTSANGQVALYEVASK